MPRPSRERCKRPARTIGLQIETLNVTSESEIDAAFAHLAERRAGALLVDTDAFQPTRPTSRSGKTPCYFHHFRSARARRIYSRRIVRPSRRILRACQKLTHLSSDIERYSVRYRNLRTSN